MFKLVKEKDVRNLIAGLKSSKAIGLDCIDEQSLKLVKKKSQLV